MPGYVQQLLRPRTLVLIAAVLVGLYVLGEADPGDWMALIWAFDHPVALIFSLLLLLLVAVVRLQVRSGPLRVVKELLSWA